MNKRALKLQKKKPYHFIISIVLIIIITFLFMFKVVPNGKLLYYVSYPCIYLKEKIATLKDNNKLVKENELLKNKIDEYRVNKTENELLKEDIITLKKMLDLNNIYNTYNIYHATIIDKNKDYYGSEIIIDKGKKSNIEKQMACLCDNYLIGIVSRIYDDTSVVKLLLGNNFNKIPVSIKTSNGDVSGLIEEFDTSNNYLVISEITSFLDIKIGDDVVTSKSDFSTSKIPSNIKIGNIKEIKDDNLGISKILYIDTKKIDKCNYVSVIGNTLND